MPMYRFAAHQRYGKFMLDVHDELAIFMDMGCGKTALALWWVRDALRDGRIDDALVICPASLVPSWEDAIEDMIRFETFTEDDIQMMRERIRIVSFQRTYQRIRSTKRIVPLRDEVDKEWGAVIVDESHCIGAHNSIQSKAAIALGTMAKKKILMSATPTHGGGGGADFSKLYGQFQFLTGGKMWKNWTDFCAKCVTSFDMWHKPRSYNVELCKGLMQEMSITCKLEDCFDMPAQIEKDIPCPLEEKDVYKDIKEGNLEKYGIDVTVAGAQYLKMLQVCSGSMKREADVMTFDTSKEDALKDLISSTDDQVVVFCNFTASVDRCAEICRKAHRRVQIYDGRSKRDTWKDLVSGKCDVLVCQYQSGGVGLNLQTAHIMIMYEPCLSSLLMAQAKGRIYRKGQEKRCLYYYLYTPATIEQKVLRTVKNGVDVNTAMLAEWSTEMN